MSEPSQREVDRCAGKRMYRTEREIRAVARLRSKDGGVGTLRVYACGVCGGFHLTSLAEFVPPAPVD